jgi:hypothetical protein
MGSTLQYLTYYHLPMTQVRSRYGPELYFEICEPHGVLNINPEVAAALSLQDLSDTQLKIIASLYCARPVLPSIRTLYLVIRTCDYNRCSQNHYT